MEQNERRFAVLIDADNVSPKYIKYILDEVSDVGIATYKRIYGDWTDNEKRSWKNVLLDWSVNPIQQYSYTAGKNATDSAMIIDAMDILYSGNVDGFCLVSSDSDFTKLAQRLREAGMFVMGIGEQKTPKPFRAACDTFKLLEIISSDDTPETSVIENQKTITNIDEIQKAITKLLIENNSQTQANHHGPKSSFQAKTACHKGHKLNIPGSHHPQQEKWETGCSRQHQPHYKNNNAFSRGCPKANASRSGHAGLRRNSQSCRCHGLQGPVRYPVIPDIHKGAIGHHAIQCI